MPVHGQSERAFLPEARSLSAVNNLGLYLVAVSIWGSTWLAITYQLGRVAPEVSVAYRFALASAFLFAWCLARGLRLRFSAREHAWMAAQGALLFGLNYVCVYLAEGQISSGLVALIFSLIVFLNIAGTRLLFGTKLKAAILFGAALGVGGVALVFMPELGKGHDGGNAWLGLVFALIATFSAACGNMVAARNQRHGLPVIQLNTFGMLYGAVFVGAYAAIAGRHFGFDTSPGYLLSLGYLALFGSVFAFGAYLTLVGRIGADRAGYTGAMIPIVAIVLSTFFEGFQWHATTAIGVAFCLVGNVLVLRAKRAK